MAKKKKKSFTKEQLRRFMEGESAYEAMGGTKSLNAGKQQFMSQEVEKLLRKWNQTSLIPNEIFKAGKFYLIMPKQYQLVI